MGRADIGRFAVNIKSTDNKNPLQGFFVYALGEKVACGQHHAFSPARVTFYINVSLWRELKPVAGFFLLKKSPAGSATGKEYFI